MNIDELAQKIEKEGSVEIPKMFAGTVMDECTKHGVNCDWTFSVRGGKCKISRPLKQGEDHPLYSR